ncbi:unnamed protein product [Parnassius apollo]|uniref:(apollo) hypothetical protein n=1 Tax=Parnassius apollo TaxID=110799 RepID=A0A8S3X4C3_PARAO|nr:unnamed protein product [Parnassius apollo]
MRRSLPTAWASDWPTKLFWQPLLPALSQPPLPCGGLGWADYGVGCDLAAASGGGWFPCLQCFPIPPVGVSMLSENEIAVSYLCGNGAVGIVSKDIAPAWCYPAAAGLAYGPGLAAEIGYGPAIAGRLFGGCGYSIY